MIDARVFVVGCPRSGTTLIQAMLTSHPLVTSFPETHFFSIAYPRNRLKRVLSWPSLNVHGLLGEFVRELGRPELVSLVQQSIFCRNYQNSFLRVLDRLTEGQGKRIWVEKTPRHLHFIEEIDRRVPRARFIHILRDGRDVVASLYRATQSNPRLWGGRLSARACVDRWNADIQHSMRYRNRPEHLLLRYSDLVSAPERQSRVICAFLEIGYEPMMVAPERAFTEIVRPEERWKSNNATPIQPKESAFDSLFDADEREWILKHLIRFSASDGLGRTAI